MPNRSESPVPGSTGTAMRGEALLAGLLLLATVVVYLPAIRGGFVWDDDFYVTGNRNLADLSGLVRIWTETSATPQYYPLTHTTFWIEHKLWGLDPMGYHVVNVLLHAASAILLGRLLRRLEVPGAWLAAAVFALHPVHVESVAWITERKNTLSGFFYLVSATVFLKWGLTDRGRPAAGSGRPALAALLFVAGLLSKTVVSSLPVALAIVSWWKTGRFERRWVPWLAAMLVAGATMGSLTAHLEKVQVGAEGNAFDLSFAERTLVAGRAIWFYAGKLLWPHPLAFNYARRSPDTGDPAQWAYPVAAAAAFAALWLLRGRLGRAPVAAAAFFGVSLAPALGYFDIFPMKYSFVADHFQYLASLGPIALASAGLALRWKRWRLPSAVILAGVLGVLTWNHAGAFRDLETLWRRTVATVPDAFMAQYNLGKILHARGDVDGAIARYREALRANPDFAPALVNVGNYLAERGETREAIEHYLRAIRSEPEEPLVHYNLGLLLQESGRLAEAELAYRDAMQLSPSLGAAPGNLAILLYRRGAYREAWDLVREARRRGTEPHPDFLRALSAAMPEPR